MEGGEELNFRILPGGGHPWGRDMLRYHLDIEQPDILFILCDSFMLSSDGPGHPVNNWFANYDTSPAKVVYYFPSDGDYLPYGCKPAFEKPDRVIAMAKYGKKWLTEIQKWRTQCDYIPHAIDHTVFYPRSQERILQVKQAYSKLTGMDLVNKKVFGVMARNQPRKQLSTMIKAWAKFAKGKNDVALFLHTMINDPASNVNLFDLAGREGCRNTVTYNPRLLTFYFGIPTNDMADLYSIFYANCSPTTGEGFGIGTIESMACGVPNIITNYTTSEELVRDTGYLVPVKLLVTGTYEVERGFVDEKDMADGLQYAYDNEEEWRKKGKAGRRVVLDEYTWDVVMPQWKKLLDEVISK